MTMARMGDSTRARHWAAVTVAGRLMWMTRPLFLDEGLEHELRTQGFAIVELMSRDEATSILDQFRALSPADGFRPDGLGVNRARYHCTFLDESPTYKAATHDIVQREFQSRVDTVLDRCEILTGNLYVKPPGLGRIEIHQNWPTLADMRETAVTVWCPLVDVSPENGTIQVVPRSHKLLADISAVSAPKFFDSFYDELIERWLQPITLRAGECLVFDDSLIHWSDDNRGDSERWAVQVVCVPREFQTVVYHYDAERDPPAFEIFAVDSDFYINEQIGALIERPSMLPSLGFAERSNLDLTEVQFADLMARGAKVRERVFAGLSDEQDFGSVPGAVGGQMPHQGVEARSKFTSLGKWADVSTKGLAAYPDAIDRIYDGSLDGMTIRGVLDPAEVTRAIERAECFRPEFKDHGKQLMFGTPLVGADETRSDYFANAWQINSRLADLFDSDFTARIGAVLSTVAGGRPAVVPTEGPGREYVPATFRFLPPGQGVMHAHTANEFCNVWSSYDHLRSTARMWNSLSYFIVGEQPDVGGDLVLYDLEWDDTPTDIAALPMSQERDDLLARFPQRPIAPEPGDMILFTGGRIWHRVAPVSGTRRRVTIGGFVALSLDGDRVFFWS